MPKIDRREFILGAAASAAFAPLHIGHADSLLAIRVTPPTSDWPVIPADFIGLSYEMGQLYNPLFFSNNNKPLIEAFSSLNTSGILRLGGHLSNITPWEGVGQSDPKQVRGVRHGIEDYWEWPLVDPVVQQNRHGMLTRKALTNLRGFLDAVNWRLLYGLNFACGSAARAADEAAAVSTIIGDRLIAFVIGNEADGFGDDPFFRLKGYDFDQYFDEYETWVTTIREKTPHAQFAGPDTENKVGTWVLEYARRTRGDAVLLTSHFYGMGPASDPNMTAQRLLEKKNPQLETQIAAVAIARREAGGTPYRMDEGNSCFGGGRKDVSDSYASALWAADYVLKVACACFAGVNFHGGGVGVYTPIESSATAPAAPRPVYYGLQFAQMFVGCRIAPCVLSTSANITAYQAIKTEGANSGKAMLGFVNKGETAVPLTLPQSFARAAHLLHWELRGPSLAAKSDVRFEPVPRQKPTASIEIAPYSAAIFQIA